MPSNTSKPSLYTLHLLALALALAAMTTGVLAQNGTPVTPAPTVPATPVATEPVTATPATTAPAATAPAASTPAQANSGADLPDFLSTFYTEAGGASKVKTFWSPSIAVSSPAYCSNIKGDVNVTFTARRMTTVHALCWQQPTTDNPSPWGHDVDLAPDLKLEADGSGSFAFHADQFPNGPINLRIYAKDDDNRQDYCELQLFNEGGVVWNQGIPKTNPSAANGMKLVFSDDFDGPLSIATDDKDTTAKYWTHWGGGDGSSWPFTNNSGPNNPFSQVKGQIKNFLRIHASKPPGTRGSTGSLTPSHFSSKAPCYLECRFLAQNATGTWPAFWGGSKKPEDLGTNKGPCDELDVIEAYGTNSKNGGIWTGYHATTHFWGQPAPAWVTSKTMKGPDGNPYDAHKMVETMQTGGKSSWSTTFHTYGLLITHDFTAYYLDDIEVLRHPTGEISANNPFIFIVNLAIGGSWPANLLRYGNQSDMWVDYIRVYQY